MGAFASLTDERFHAWGAAVASPRFDAYREYIAGLDATASGDREAERHLLTAATLDTAWIAPKLMLLADRRAPLSRLEDSLMQAAEAMRRTLTPYDEASLDAIEAKTRGDLEAAYLAAHRRLRIAPSSFESKIFLANVSLHTLRYREAVRIYQTVDRAGWPTKWDYFWKGDVDALHNVGDFARELRDATAARRKYPRNSGICQLQIRPLAALGREQVIDSIVESCASMPGTSDRMFMRWTAGRELFAHQHTEASKRYLGRLIEDARAASPPRSGIVGLASLLRGDWRPFYDQSRERIKTDSLNVNRLGNYGVAAAHVGDSVGARAMLQRLSTLASPSSHGQPELWQGFILAALGNRVAAVDRLRLAASLGASPTYFFHFNAPYIEPLRGYPPFESLARGRD
jgi:hypothetical protein